MKKYVIVHHLTDSGNFQYYSFDSNFSDLSDETWLFDTEKEAESFISHHIEQIVFILPVYNL
jgi:hypothetical protein